MNIVVFAYHEIGYVCLEELIRQGDHIAALFTHQNNPHENIWYRTPDVLAESHNIPCFYDADVKNPCMVEKIRSMNPDVIFSFYFRDIIPRSVLDIPKCGAFNLHGSYLPKYRGRCPVNWVIVNGEKETGITFHYMVEKPDAGDIVAQRTIPIDRTDTAVILFNKMELSAVPLLKEVMPCIRENNVPRTKQNEADATIFPGRKPADGLIQWQASTESIYNLVRAVTKPYPGAFSYLDDRKLFVWECEAAEHSGVDAKIAPGEIIIEEQKLFVKTGNGLLWIKKYQIEDDPHIQDALLYRLNHKILKTKGYIPHESINFRS